jgi:hypothetical protein
VFTSLPCVDGIAWPRVSSGRPRDRITRATCFPREPMSLGSLPDVVAIQGKRVGQRGPVVYLVIPLREERYACVFPSQR